MRNIFFATVYQGCDIRIVVDNGVAILCKFVNDRIELGANICPCLMRPNQIRDIDDAGRQVLAEKLAEKVIWPKYGDDLQEYEDEIDVGIFIAGNDEQIASFSTFFIWLKEDSMAYLAEKDATLERREEAERLAKIARNKAMMEETYERTVNFLIADQRFADAKVMCELKGWKLVDFIKLHPTWESIEFPDQPEA